MRSEKEDKRTYKVRKICSVCEKDMGEVESPINKDSHGYCPECAMEERKKMMEAVFGSNK